MNFCKAIILKAHLAKCKVYFGGMQDHDQQTIRAVIELTRGTLPFKYLGVSLSLVGRLMCNNVDL